MSAALFELPAPAKKRRHSRSSCSNGTYEWYSPADVIEAAHETMGGIDLDPASCEFANRTVRATKYYSLEDDAFSHDWQGRVWLNPPFNTGVIERFVGKLVSHYEHPAGGVTEAILLTSNNSETGWFRLAGSRSSSICCPFQRLVFSSTDGKRHLRPTQGHFLFYYGRNPERFKHCFSHIGKFVKWDPYERHDLLSGVGR